MDTNKRKFLFGKASEIRPPWSLIGDDFFSACTRCGDCLQVCPEKIIVTDRFSYPLVDFQKGFCNFCGACREACRAAASSSVTFAFHDQVTPWSHTVHISESCLAVRGTLCRTCGEECEARAISFTPRQGGFAIPSIDHQLCSGCGACFSPCPVSAITLS